MGIYDTLNFTCPACGKETFQQSKAGKCILADYTLNNAPLLTIADIHDDGKNGKLYCVHCSTELELEVRFMVTPRIKSSDNEERNFRTI